MGHAMPPYIGEINLEHIGLARVRFRSPSQHNGGQVSGLRQTVMESFRMFPLGLVGSPKKPPANHKNTIDMKYERIGVSWWLFWGPTQIEN